MPEVNSAVTPTGLLGHDGSAPGTVTAAAAKTFLSLPTDTAASIAALSPSTAVTAARTFTLADDAATSFTVPVPAGDKLTLAVSDGAAISGQFALDAGASAACSIILATSEFAVTTGVLAGTTGTDAKITVSCHTNGLVYVENRSGGSLTFLATFEGEAVRSFIEYPGHNNGTLGVNTLGISSAHSPVTSGTRALTADLLEYNIFELRYPILATGLGLRVTVAQAASGVKMRIYSVGSTGLPLASVSEEVTVDTTSTNDRKTAFGTPVRLAAGYYFIAKLPSTTTITVRAQNTAPCTLLGMDGGSQIYGLSKASQAYATGLPSTPIAPTTTITNAAVVDFIQY